MKLEFNSRNLLATTKALAKMREFNVLEEDKASFSGSPKRLLVLTIGILGEVAAIESQTTIFHEPSDEGYSDLKKQLILVAQYFDSLDYSAIDVDISDYLKMLGSSAYYLADMPGSTAVLAGQLVSDSYDLTPSRLEGPLIQLIKGTKAPSNSTTQSDFRSVNLAVIAFFQFLNKKIYLIELQGLCELARAEVYEHGNDREIFFIDIIIAIIKRRVINSSVICLPLYTGLSLNEWAPILDRSNFISEFWPAQHLLGRAGVFMGKSAVVQLPTSAGKTKSTEIIVRSAFLSGRANLAIIVAPFRALCREISGSFKDAFDGENISINELLDLPQIDNSEIDFLKFFAGAGFQNPLERKTVLISTPEKLVYLLRHKPELASRIGLLIFDEGHQFDDGPRGVTYELLITSLKSLIAPSTQMVLISAVIANAASIGDWLFGEEGVEINGATSLPTIRSIAFASWPEAEGQLNYIDSESVISREFIVPRFIEPINLGRTGNEKKDRYFPIKKNRPSISAYLSLKLAQHAPVAVFCGTKISVNAVCKEILKAYERNFNIPRPIETSSNIEILKLSNLSILHFGKEDVVSKSISIGVLPHSASIPNGLRLSIEWAMANGKANLVVCTSTLAQGVNLPIKYLIVSTTNQAQEKISTRDFHNLMGRVGRSGYYTEGSVIFSDVELFEKRFERAGRWKWKTTMELLDSSNTEHCVSSLKELIEPNLGLAWDSIEFIRNPEGVKAALHVVLETRDGNNSKIVAQVDNFDLIVQKIESFMLASLKDDQSLATVEYFSSLARSTLAYHLSSESEKLRVIEVFDTIARNVMKVPSHKLAYYGKALLGIRQLEYIETWLKNSRFEIMLCVNSSELLDCCWPLLEQLAIRPLIHKIRPPSALLTVADAWIKGDSYKNLFITFRSGGAFSQAKKTQMDITMHNVVEFTDNFLGYDSMLIIGALADMVEYEFENLDMSSRIRSLQTSLKFGLYSELEKFLYIRGISDREVCKILATELLKVGVDSKNFENGILRQYQATVSSVLLAMPGYFSSLKL